MATDVMVRDRAHARVRRFSRGHGARSLTRARARVGRKEQSRAGRVLPQAAPGVPAASERAAAAGPVEQIVTDTLKFIFQEYDADKDGLMTRKEFFTVRAAAPQIRTFFFFSLLL